jgi:hypothetical protein
MYFEPRPLLTDTKNSSRAAAGPLCFALVQVRKTRQFAQEIGVSAWKNVANTAGWRPAAGRNVFGRKLALDGRENRRGSSPVIVRSSWRGFAQADISHPHGLLSPFLWPRWWLIAFLPLSVTRICQKMRFQTGLWMRFSRLSLIFMLSCCCACHLSTKFCCAFTSFDLNVSKRNDCVAEFLNM